MWRVGSSSCWCESIVRVLQTTGQLFVWRIWQTLRAFDSWLYTNSICLHSHHSWTEWDTRESTFANVQGIFIDIYFVYVCLYACFDILPVHGLKISHRIPIVLNKDNLWYEGCVTWSRTSVGSVAQERAVFSLNCLVKILEFVKQLLPGMWKWIQKESRTTRNSTTDICCFTYSICSRQIQAEASYVRCEK